MQLKIEHVAPYLPYGLKGVCLESVIDPTDDQSGIYEMNGIYTYDKCITFKDGFDVYLDDDQTDFKPILRPLSDLTKEIEHNGERFVPRSNLFKIAEFNSPKMDYKNILESPFYLVDQLFQWHFDIFNLIPEGLAVDYNTVKEKV